MNVSENLAVKCEAESIPFVTCLYHCWRKRARLCADQRMKGLSGDVKQVASSDKVLSVRVQVPVTLKTRHVRLLIGHIAVRND